MGIRLKLIFPVLVALILIFVIPYILWLPSFIETEKEVLLQKEQQSIQIFAIALVQPLIEEDLGQTHALADSIRHDKSTWRSIRIYDKNNAPLYPLNPSKHKPAEQQEFITQAIMQLDNQLGKIEVIVDFEEILRQTTQRISRVAYLIFGLIAASAVLSTLMQDRFIRIPLQRLSAAARHIANGNFNAPLPAETNDEVGELTKAFKKMGQGLHATQKKLLEEVSTAKTMLDALNSSEERLHAVIDNIADGLVTITEKGLIESVNPSLCTLLGYQEDELINQNVSILIPQEYNIAHNAFLQRYIKTGKGNVIGNGPRELEIKKSNGENIPVDIAISPMKLNNKLYFIGLVRDISEQKKAAREKETLLQQLQQAQKMEAIGQLTGGIAHDFNNILSAIIGYTELSIELSADHGDNQLSSYLNEVYKASERAQRLIKQMLAFSSGEVGEPQHVNAAEITSDAVKMLMSTIPSSIKIELNTATDLPLIEVDPVQLHQVIINLIINARDALDGKGNINVSLGLAMIDRVCNSCHERFNGQYVELSIKDNGTGIPDNVIQRMFDPFFTTKEVGKGTGMGLSMVHGIVHASGGHILVDTSSDNGTEIHILFPAIAHNANNPILQEA